MTFKLRTIGLTAAGREIVRDRDLAGTLISVGRAADNDVHLPDLSIEAHHATITALEGDRIAVKAVGSLGFTRDGINTTETEIDTRGGAELGFGTYRVTVSREAGDTLLTVRQGDDSAARSGDLEHKRGFSLATVLPSKRVVSWGLALLIVILFTAIPIISHQTRDVEAKQRVIGDDSWSTGDLSFAHHKLSDQCEVCHVNAFEAVTDKTCLSCHEDTLNHADPSRVDVARGPGSFGDRLLWSVAHTFGKPGPGACTDCHTEHEGPVRLTTPSQQFCADCHETMDQRLRDTRLGNAADFGKLHPQFAPAIITDANIGKPERVSLDSKPREDSGLSFPHKLHLDPLGGVARMAANIGAERGYGTGGLQCSDCHRKTEDGIRFRPIEMERDCEACHSLTYDQVGGIFRKLTHGDVAQVVADLSAADLRRPAAEPRRRPGDYAQGQPYYFNFSGNVWKGLQIRTALSRDGLCGECHRPATTTDGKITVMPVTLVTRYMHHGWFDHETHKQEDCASCHAAGTSTTSADLLLPGIKDCRTCHLGEDTAARDKVASTCAMCHDYHTTATGTVREAGRKTFVWNTNRARAAPQ